MLQPKLSLQACFLPLDHTEVYPCGPVCLLSLGSVNKRNLIFSWASPLSCGQIWMAISKKSVKQFLLLRDGSYWNQWSHAFFTPPLLSQKSKRTTRSCFLARGLGSQWSWQSRSGIRVCLWVEDEVTGQLDALMGIKGYPPAVVRSVKSMRGNYTAVILCSRRPHPSECPPTLGFCHLMPLEGKTAHCSCLCNREIEHHHRDATLHQFLFPPRVADGFPSTANSYYRQLLTGQQYRSEAGGYLFFISNGRASCLQHDVHVEERI